MTDTALRCHGIRVRIHPHMVSPTLATNEGRVPVLWVNPTHRVSAIIRICGMIARRIHSQQESHHA